MTLLELEYFIIVAKHENMSKAARELHISQPAISKIIKQLETRLNTKLFFREKSKIILNKQGKILLNYSNKIFALVDGARLEIDEYNEILDNTIDISLKVASNMFYDLIKDFAKLNPHIKYNVTQISNTNIEYDISVFTSNKKIDIENTILLFIEDIKIAVPINHKLAKFDTINLSHLTEEFFVLLNQDKPLRKILNNFLTEKEFIPKIFWETDNPEMCRNIVETELAISFFPCISWKDYFSDKIKLLKISDTEFKRYVYLQLKNVGYQTKAAINFKNFVVNYFSDIQ